MAIVDPSSFYNVDMDFYGTYIVEVLVASTRNEAE